jgi:hypothetical protein
MVLDDFTDSFWDSGVVTAANVTVAVEALAETVESIEVQWTRDYAQEYRLLARNSGSVWTLLEHQTEGTGGVAFTELDQPLLVGSGLELRVEMIRPATGGARYGIKNLAIFGRKVEGVPLTTTANVTGAGNSALFTLAESITPAVVSVVPVRGTTAGGSDVTITGRFFSAQASDLVVSMGPFPCAIKTVASITPDQQQIVCVTSASGILHGGHKYVSVTVKEHGSTVPMENATFWYIDTWGSRTTWGGSAPPTGCGSWVHDKDCTDTVYIPEGQVVLLDQDLPRFYLLLIEGSLIFDRKDITLSASYILLRGGTLQIGTETEPFTHKVLITLYGHPKSMELPTFGAKVIACYECKIDIHGTPQVAWTQLTATANVGDSEITLLDPVQWPVDSRVVIATTDFESPLSSHTELATVAAVLDNGHRVQLKDVRVCPRYSFRCVSSV